MVKKYSYTETLVRIVEIEGKDEHEIEEKAMRLYDEGKIKLQSGYGSKDFKLVQVKEV